MSSAAASRRAPPRWPPSTIGDAVDFAAACWPDSRAYTWLDDSGEEEASLTFAQVAARVDVIASHLQHALRLRRGQSVLVLHPSGLEFLLSLLACFKLGVVAVPAYPPLPQRLAADLKKLEALMAACGPVAVLTTTTYNRLRQLSSLRHTWPGKGVPWYATDAWQAPCATASGGAAAASLMSRLWGAAAVSAPAALRAPQKGRKPGDGEAPAAADASAGANDDGVIAPPPRSTDIAYLQYTSGSTGNPKGVIITHANMVHNVLCGTMGIHPAAQPPRGVSSNGVDTPPPSGAQRVCVDDVVVVWLPQYHDMGLINFLSPMLTGCHVVGMSPLAFVRQPLLWLQVMSRYKATSTSAPPFALQLAVNRSAVAEATLRPLDLSSVRTWCIGAEPIQPATLHAFLKAFGPYGVTATALRPSYGMAEHVVFICGPSPTDPVTWVVDARHGTPRVSCGSVRGPGATQGMDLRIVDPELREELPEGAVGEIWVSSPSKGQGYWGQPALTTETFEARLVSPPSAAAYLRTGDLGYVADGRLFVSGRIKDTIIVGGRNFYAADIEACVIAATPELRPGCLAAVAVETSAGTEGVGLMAEVRAQHVKTLSPEQVSYLCASITSAVQRDCGVGVASIALVPPGTVPKTTSGKVKRLACRDLLEAASSSGNGVRLPILGGGAPWAAAVQGAVTQPQTRSSTSRSMSCADAAAETAVRAVHACGGSDDGTDDGSDSAHLVVIIADPDSDAGSQTGVAAPAGGKAAAPAGVKEAAPAASAGLIEKLPPQAVALALAPRLLIALEQCGASDPAVTVGESGVSSVQLFPLLDALNTAVGWQLFTPADLLTSTPQQVVHTACKAVLRRRQWRLLTLMAQLDLEAAQGPLSAEGGRKSSAAAARWRRAAVAVGRDVFNDLESAAKQMTDATAPTRAAAAAVAKPSLNATPADGVWRAPWPLWHSMQLLGSLLVYATAGVALLPCYLYVQLLRRHTNTLGQPWAYLHLSSLQASPACRAPAPGIFAPPPSGLATYGLLVGLVFPLWMTAMTAQLLAAKWLLIGRYRAGCIPTRSWAHLRWWFVDRLMDWWWAWPGILISHVDWLHILVIKLLGGRVAWSASVEGLPREPDLVNIGAGATVRGTLLCRAVWPQHVYLAPVSVGAGAVVGQSAVVEPGACLAPGCRMAPLAVAPESAHTQPGTCYAGNPMQPAADDAVLPAQPLPSTTQRLMQMVGALPLTLALFHCHIPVTAAWYWVGLPDFRYTPLLYYTTVVFGSAFVMLLVILILRRCVHLPLLRAGVPVCMLAWVIDLSGAVADRLLLGFFNCSLLYPTWWWLMGADINPFATVFAGGIGLTYSRAHLLRAGRNLFLSRCELLTDGSDGAAAAAGVSFGVNCEVGLMAVVDPGTHLPDNSAVGGVTHAGPRATLAPFAYWYGADGAARSIKTATGGAAAAASFADGRSAASSRRVTREDPPGLTTTLLLGAASCVVPCAAFVGLVLATTIPSYELAVAMLFGCAEFFTGSGGGCATSTPPAALTRDAAVVLMFAPMLVAACSAMLYCTFLTRLLVDHSTDARVLDGWGLGCICWGAQNLLNGLTWNLFARPFAGTEVMAWLYRLRGAHIGRHTTLLTKWPMKDCHRVSVGDRVVLDGSHVSAHAFEQGLLLFKESTCVGADAIVQHDAMIVSGAHVPANVVVGPGTHGSRDAFTFAASGGNGAALLLQGCPVAEVVLLPGSDK